MHSLVLPIPWLNSSTIKSLLIWPFVLIRKRQQNGILILPIIKPTGRKHRRSAHCHSGYQKNYPGFNIPIMELDGFEADDVIGTLSKQAAEAGYEVFMVTPDKDYGQLVSEKVKIYKPGYQGGDVEIMGPKEVWKNGISKMFPR